MWYVGWFIELDEKKSTRTEKLKINIIRTETQLCVFNRTTPALPARTNQSQSKINRVTSGQCGRGVCV